MNQPLNLLELIDDTGPLTMDSLGPCIGDDGIPDDGSIGRDGDNTNSQHSLIKMQSGQRAK